MRKMLSGGTCVSFLMGLLTAGGLGAPSGEPDPEEIIQRFAARESEFLKVWEQYTYTQTILVQVLDNRRQPQEQREIQLEVYFTTEGERRMRILYDRGALRSVRLTDEDFHDALHLQPFVLTRAQLPLYEINFRGKERVDELDTYVFDVRPRRMEQGERYFEGRIWVDDHDYQIVMTRGKAVPDLGRNKFLPFETLRQQVDGKYWFPTWSEGDDVLDFGRRNRVRIRQLITYKDFKRFEVDATIHYERSVPEP